MPSPKRKTEHKRLRLEGPDRAALALLFVYLLTEILSGAIRYYAVRLHLTLLVYLPHLLVVAALAPLFFIYVLSEGITPTYLAICIIFGVGATYGVFNLGNPSQVEFGFWVLAAFLFGIVVLPAIVRAWTTLKSYVLLLWALATAGVLINIFYQWPWVGLNYQVGATTVQASRLWIVAGMGFARLPGFSRASFDAAFQILILALFLRGTLRRRWWIPVWILSGIAITLTTDKTAIGSFLIFSGMWIVYRGKIRPSWRLIPIAAVCLDILAPFSMLFVRTDWLKSVQSPVLMMLAGSFLSRFQVGWPEWIRMIIAHGSVLFGRGLGGIGTAQMYFEPSLYSPGDNIAVYLYGAFGVLGLALILYYGWKSARMPAENSVAKFFFYCACVVLIEGFMVNVVEGTFTALALGTSLRFLEAYPGKHPSLSAACRKGSPTPPVQALET